MTAFSRLWSRAPVWRGALVLGLATTALAALYPPLGGPAQQPTAHYDPLPAPPPTPVPAMPATVASVTPPAPAAAQPMAPTPSPVAPAAVSSAGPGQAPGQTAGVKPDGPAFGSTVNGMIAFAGDKVPLPAGDWVVVAALGGRTAAGKPGTSAMLAQTAGGQLTALIALNAVGKPREAGTGFPRVADCQETRNVYSRVFVARDSGEQACWSVDALTLPWDDASNRLRASAVAELRQRGDALPQLMVRTRLVRADTSHLLLMEIFQAVAVPPDGLGGWDWSHIMATPDRLARMTRLRDWAAAWWPLVQRGFSDQLAPADVTPALARLPS